MATRTRTRPEWLERLLNILVRPDNIVDMGNSYVSITLTEEQKVELQRVQKEDDTKKMEKANNEGQVYEEPEKSTEDGAGNFRKRTRYDGSNNAGGTNSSKNIPSQAAQTRQGTEKSNDGK